MTRNHHHDAGKGPQPRHVNGDRYRAGWERIWGNRGEDSKEQRRERKLAEAKAHLAQFVDEEEFGI